MLRTCWGGVFTARSEGRTYVVASNSDIAPDIADSRADFALLGSDKYGELARPRDFCFEPVGKLACRFVLAVPDAYTSNPETPLITATTYPNGLRSFLGASTVNACLGPVRSGKTEAAIGQGIADAIFDICETGQSLQANGLRILAEGDYLELGGLWRSEEV